MRRAVALVATIAAAASLAVVTAIPAVAEEFDPYDFDVQVDMGEDVDWGEPACDGDGHCTVHVQDQMYGDRSVGTVSVISSGLSGSIKLVCDFGLRMDVEFDETGSGPDFTVFDGVFNQSCAWFMDYEDGSTLSGQIRGRMTQTLVGDAPDRVRFQGNFDVDVVAGSGVFAGYVGSGSFNEDFTEVMGGSGGPSAPVHSALAVRAAEDGGMNTELVRTGGFRTSIVSPRARLSRRDRSSLVRVVAARGSSCVAKARKGDVVKRLGSAADDNRDGIVSFERGLGPTLGRGEWTITARCTGKVGGERSTDGARRTVTVS